MVSGPVCDLIPAPSDTSPGSCSDSAPSRPPSHPQHTAGNSLKLHKVFTHNETASGKSSLLTKGDVRRVLVRPPQWVCSWFAGGSRPAAAARSRLPAHPPPPPPLPPPLPPLLLPLPPPQDKRTGKTVFKIWGSAPHSTFLQSPAKPGLSLQLAGDLLYAQLFVTDKTYSLHVDIDTATGEVVRLSLGNTYRKVKLYRNAAGPVIQHPMPKEMAGRWTIVAVDIPAVLAKFANTNSLHFKAIRGVQVCACSMLRNIYTSTEVYTTDSLPRDMRLPVPGAESWADLYQWYWIAAEPRKAPQKVLRPARIAKPAAQPPKPALPKPAQLDLLRTVGYSGERARVLLWSHNGEQSQWRELLFICCNLLHVGRCVHRDWRGMVSMLTVAPMARRGDPLRIDLDGRGAQP